ncbi:MAG: shikimate kinase [Oscillospiraceae bacterium]|nr:shikimate kinase [Oscillospiraceae bacterium]
MEFALIGKSLSHSCSRELHGVLGDYNYSHIELEPQELEPFFLRRDFKGVNVTIPYKRDVLAFCDSLSDRAEKIGAVNTVLKTDDGKLFGDNTDYSGFLYSCRRAGIELKGEKVLILGSGGASLTVQAVAKDQGAAQITVLKRDDYANITPYARHTVLVNCTPVGMYPNVFDRPLVSLADFPDCIGVADLIYNPLNTLLLQDAAARGITHTNGLAMLAAQAKYAADSFTGKTMPDEVIEKAMGQLVKTRQNIVLIGMPACGKSTVGKRLARRLGLQFMDGDEEIVRREGRTIPQIFEQSGEEAFRALESAVLLDICKTGGQVISTGGGAVLAEENRRAMHLNGWLVWLQRDIAELTTTGRPLSASAEAIEKLWKIRQPIYGALADVTAMNSDLEKCTEEIICKLS